MPGCASVTLAISASTRGVSLGSSAPLPSNSSCHTPISSSCAQLAHQPGPPLRGVRLCWSLAVRVPNDPHSSHAWSNGSAIPVGFILWACEAFKVSLGISTLFVHRSQRHHSPHHFCSGVPGGAFCISPCVGQIGCPIFFSVVQAAANTAVDVAPFGAGPSATALPRPIT